MLLLLQDSKLYEEGLNYHVCYCHGRQTQFSRTVPLHHAKSRSLLQGRDAHKLLELTTLIVPSVPMKTFHATNAMIAAMALLPTSSLAKQKSPHRIFHETRSKAAKAQGLPNQSPFSDADLDVTVRSKSGNKGGTNALKELLPKTNKAGKTKCHKEEDDLSDFELTLDFVSLSMSMSMPIGKSAKASAKCYKAAEVDSPEEESRSYECVGDEDRPGVYFPLCPGLDKGAYCDGWGDCGSDFCACNVGVEFCATRMNPCSLNSPDSTLALDDWGYGNPNDDWTFGDDWTFDDDWALDDWSSLDDDFYYDEEDVIGIITWFMKLLGQCSGISINFDSCLTKNIIEVLASFPDDDSAGTMRMLRGAHRKVQAEDDLAMEYYECGLPTYEQIHDVVNEALSMCTGVTTEEYEMELDKFTRIWTNETCVCGYY